MKKNFFKFMLLGAFTLSLGVGFVGCKDYDGDIDTLQKQIDDLKTELNNSTVKSVSYDPITGILSVQSSSGNANYNLKPNLPTYTLSATPNADGTKVTIALNGGAEPSTATFDLPEVDGGDGGDPVDPFDPTKLTADADGKVLYDGKPTGVTLPKFEQEGAIIEITTVTNDDDEVTGYIISDGKVEIPITLGIADALPLKSLVFVPQVYLGGIEAMDAITIDYYKWTIDSLIPTKQDAKNATRGETWFPVKDGTKETIKRLPVVAYYHMNPASTTQAQIKAVTLLSDDLRYIPKTRAAASAPAVAKYEVVANGLLKVTFNFTSEDIEEIDDPKVTSLAIKAEVNYEGAKTDVTSDYAAVYRAIKKNFLLALNDKAVAENVDNLKQRHVYGSETTTGITAVPWENDNAVDVTGNSTTYFEQNGNKAGYARIAIANEPDYTLNYNDATGLDLKTKVVVHHKEYLEYVSEEDEVENDDKEVGLTVAELADLGLGLKFYKSNYWQGDNNTPQDEFFNLNNGVVTAKVFSTEGMAAVGREPLVRVELVDLDNNNAVVNAGWIKIRITSPGINKTMDFGNLYVECDPLERTPYAESSSMNIYVEWMNVNIYNPLNMGRNDFHTLYTLDGTTSSTNVATLQKQGDVGTVTQIVDPSNTTMTNLLVWSISNAEQEAALDKAAPNKGKVTATVRYMAPNHDDVYITLTATIIEAQATMKEKTIEYWNPEKTTTYMNVVIPGTMTNDANFYTDIDASFVGNKPQFDLPAAAVAQSKEDYQTNLKYWYRFDDAQVAELNKVPQKDAAGNEYILAVYEDAVDSLSYLLASNKGKTETQVIAVIDERTGLIEYYNGESTRTANNPFNPTLSGTSTVTTVPFTPADSTFVKPTGWAQATNENSFAEAVLNRDAAAAANMFKAPIETILNNGCIDIAVTNGKFWIAFYRPVDAKGAEGTQFSDGANDGGKINMNDLVQLTDWRKAIAGNNYWTGANKHFMTVDPNPANNTWNSIQVMNYYDYYKVATMTLDKANVTTTMNGGTLGTTKLSSITTQIVLDGFGPAAQNLVLDFVTDTDFATNKTNYDYGYVKYTNNGNPITGEFWVRLPIVVTYKWGTFTAYVDVKIVK